MSRRTREGIRQCPLGWYFRMLFIGYFEGIESERGLEWRCSDSLSLRTFLGVQVNERVPDHSSLSRMRTQLDGAVYEQVIRLVLGIMESKRLLRGKVAGVDSTYLRADASMKNLVRKDTGADYAAYSKKLCEAAGIENPTADDARRMDRARKGKKVSNEDWKSPTDADARIVRLKDGRTRLGYKAEHVVDFGDRGDRGGRGLRGRAVGHGDASPELRPFWRRACPLRWWPPSRCTRGARG